MKRNRYTPAKNLDLAEKALRKSIAYLAFAHDPEINNKVLEVIEELAMAGRRLQSLSLELADKPERCKAESI